MLAGTVRRFTADVVADDETYRIADRIGGERQAVNRDDRLQRKGVGQRDAQSALKQILLGKIRAHDGPPVMPLVSMKALLEELGKDH